jgi:imidazolonepropionase-like amidohydrolase
MKRNNQQQRKNMKKILFTSLILAAAGIVNAQQPVPAKKQSKSVLLMNGICHVGNGKVIQNSVVGFKDGVITLVGDATVMRLDLSQWDTTINIAGKHVYPGFIAPNSTLGLTEIEAVRATSDFNEVGYMNPHVRTQQSYNTDSKITPTVRTNGVLVAQITPRGGRISGTSSIMNLDGWNWEDATLKADDGVHINWPGYYSRNWSEDGPGPYERNKNYAERRAELEKFFAEARAYCMTPKPAEKNLRFEAMRGVFNGTQMIYIHADNVKDIAEAVTFSNKFGLKKVSIVGGAESYKCTELLKTNNISVMLARVHNLPMRADEDVNQPYKTAKMLQAAGVLFCFENSGDQEVTGLRNLPFLAGTAVAWGLDKEAAIAALTSNTAKMLGIGDLVGTIEEKKQATLFVSDGDALDMRTNKVTHAFIQGKSIQLINEQQQLYELYSEKYGLEPK